MLNNSQFYWKCCNRLSFTSLCTPEACWNFFQGIWSHLAVYVTLHIFVEFFSQPFLDMVYVSPTSAENEAECVGGNTQQLSRLQLLRFLWQQCVVRFLQRCTVGYGVWHCVVNAKVWIQCFKQLHAHFVIGYSVAMVNGFSLLCYISILVTFEMTIILKNGLHF